MLPTELADSANSIKAVRCDQLAATPGFGSPAVLISGPTTRIPFQIKRETAADLPYLGLENMDRGSSGFISIAGSSTSQERGTAASGQAAHSDIHSMNDENRPSIPAGAAGNPMRRTIHLNPYARAWYPRCSATSFYPHMTLYASRPVATPQTPLPTHSHVEERANSAPSVTENASQQTGPACFNAMVPVEVMYQRADLHMLDPAIVAHTGPRGDGDILRMQVQLMEQAVMFLYDSVVRHQQQFPIALADDAASGDGNIPGMPRIAMNQFFPWYPHAVEVPTPHGNLWIPRNNFVQGQRNFPGQLPTYPCYTIPAYAVYPAI